MQLANFPRKLSMNDHLLPTVTIVDKFVNINGETLVAFQRLGEIKLNLINTIMGGLFAENIKEHPRAV